MPDQPKLLFEGALKDYAKECKVVLVAYGVDPKIWDRPYPVNGRRLYIEGGAQHDFLIAALLCWLAGKGWPRDPLRSLLEDVRAQLEATNA